MEHHDVIVVGAGISGIGAGYFLQRDCPGKSYLILEGRQRLGGTWDLFRYPGVRSDSDMHTLGYSFKPWTAEKSIADGPAILEYLDETAREHGIDAHIRYDHRVTHASWSGEDSRWTLQVDTGGTSTTFTCGFLFMCSGYYDYAEGFTPELPGLADFAGEVIHPQHWPEESDLTGKRVVVIGSGATAMTLVPALAETAAHVVMLQRSPTYVVARPDTDRISNLLRKWLPAGAAYRLTRWKNTTMQQLVYARSRTKPDKVREVLLDGVRSALGEDFDVETHFTPTYDPWDQRLCLVPNGDLFDAIRSGRASVVTERIERIDADGIVVGSGERIDCDVIITATGLNLVTLGKVVFDVDGEPVDFSRTWSYKGMAYSDVPNLASSFGYINASWTLRADLTCEYVCRLLNHMDATGTSVCVPRLRPEEEGMRPRPWIEGFSAGYMQRAMHLMPRQGDHEPWLNPQNYKKDKKLFKKTRIDDGVMRFEGRQVDTRGKSTTSV